MKLKDFSLLANSKSIELLIIIFFLALKWICSVCEREKSKRQNCFQITKLRTWLQGSSYFHLFVSWQYNGSVEYSSSPQLLTAVGIDFRSHPLWTIICVFKIRSYCGCNCCEWFVKPWCKGSQQKVCHWLQESLEQALGFYVFNCHGKKILYFKEQAPGAPKSGLNSWERSSIITSAFV